MPRWLGLTSPAMRSTASGTTPSHRTRQIKLLYRACGAEVGGDAAELEPLRAQDQQPLDRAGGPGKRGHQRASNTTRLRSHDRTRVHITTGQAWGSLV